MRGPAVAALGGGLCAVGLLFGSPGLYPAGVALLLVPGIAFAWVHLAAAGLRVGRRPPEEPLTEGESRPLGIVIEAGLLPAPGARLVDPLLAAPRRFGLGSRLGALELEARLPRRGRHAQGAAELEISDPFGLASATRRSPRGGEVVVLPRIEPISFSSPGAAGRGLGLGERGFDGSGPDSWAAEFEIDGLRPYRDGSPAARIHWPTVARTDELHERRITSGADAARLVVLDPQRAAGVEQLDAVARAAASICHELGSGPGCVLLIGGEPLPSEVEGRLRNFAAAHRRIAVVEADAGEPPVHRIGRAGLAIWLSADPSRAPEARLGRLTAGRRILVRPRAGGAGGPGRSRAQPLFEVAGCEARELGTGARRAARVAA
ncbi:MAG TPA: DUF58 domain-containing protein [Solirubrobacterales bacterium]|nr:DUF58 domain-containing protein [Solirubrobacterales bacterium]